MSAFALSGLAVAARRLECAIRCIEDYCDIQQDSGRPRSLLIGSAFAELLALKGQLSAVTQLLEMQEMLESAPTEPPPALRVVR